MRFETGPRPVGRWSWNVGSDEWVWNDVMFRIHGYEPDSVVPRTDLLIAHKVEEDRAEVIRTIEALRSEPAEFAVTSRIRGRYDLLTPVAVFGRPSDDRPDVLVGWTVPLTDAYLGDAPEPSAEALARDVDNLRRGLLTREVIGQAKGVLRSRMGLTDDGAFETLRWISQHTNLKLAVVADRLVVHAAEQLPVSAEEKQRFTKLVLDLIDTLRTP